eukprot:1501029-Pyramimonas_sp.AAC.1
MPVSKKTAFVAYVYAHVYGHPTRSIADLVHSHPPNHNVGTSVSLTRASPKNFSSSSSSSSPSSTSSLAYCRDVLVSTISLFAFGFASKYWPDRAAAEVRGATVS